MQSHQHSSRHSPFHRHRRPAKIINIDCSLCGILGLIYGTMWSWLAMHGCLILCQVQSTFIIPEMLILIFQTLPPLELFFTQAIVELIWQIVHTVLTPLRVLMHLNLHQEKKMYLDRHIRSACQGPCSWGGWHLSAVIIKIQSANTKKLLTRHISSTRKKKKFSPPKLYLAWCGYFEVLVHIVKEKIPMSALWFTLGYQMH